MKAIVVLVLMGAVACGAIYYFGGYASFDPTEQGRKARDAIKPGMTWKQVADMAGDPKEYQVYQEHRRGTGDNERIILTPGAYNKFDRRRMAERIAASELPHGFIFRYNFSAQAAFSVFFDDRGSVVEVADGTTMTDLLELNQQ